MLNIALWLVCFYDAIIILLIPSSANLLFAEDGGAGHFVVYMGAAILGFYTLITNNLKQIPNKWMILLLIFIVFSALHSPNISFESTFTPRDPGLFNYKPMFEATIFLFMFMAIHSMHINQDMRYKTYKTIALIGIVYSVYVIFQNFGMDQIYKLVGTRVTALTRNPTNGGFIGQPVFAAVVLAISFPFVMKFKPAWVLPIVIAMITTGNRSGLVALAVMTVFLFGGIRYAFYAICSYVGILGLMEAIYWVNPNFNFHIQFDGRLEQWQLMIKDYIHPHFPGINKSYLLTGTGLGSFSVLFPFYNHSNFMQAHNEYLEVFMTLSIIGLYLFLKMIKHIFEHTTDECIFAALLALCVYAMTEPIWHIPQIQFLTVLLVGMAYNKESSYELGTNSR